MLTVVVDVTATVARLNACEVVLAPTVTLALGTTAGFELVSATDAPLDGATPDKVTVTLMLLPPTTDVGDTETEVTAGNGTPIEIVPPTEVMAVGLPIDNTAKTLVGVRAA